MFCEYVNILIVCTQDCMNDILNRFFFFFWPSTPTQFAQYILCICIFEFFLALHSNRCKTTTIDCCFNLISTNLKGDFMNDCFWCPDALERVRCQIQHITATSACQFHYHSICVCQMHSKMQLHLYYSEVQENLSLKEVSGVYLFSHPSSIKKNNPK